MKVRLAVLLCLVGSASSVVAARQAPDPRPITVDDLFGIRAVHDPQISPDGQVIAYTDSDGGWRSGSPYERRGLFGSSEVVARRQVSGVPFRAQRDRRR